MNVRFTDYDGTLIAAEDMPVVPSLLSTVEFGDDQSYVVDHVGFKFTPGRGGKHGARSRSQTS